MVQLAQTRCRSFARFVIPPEILDAYSRASIGQEEEERSSGRLLQVTPALRHRAPEVPKKAPTGVVADRTTGPPEVVPDDELTQPGTEGEDDERRRRCQDGETVGDE